MHQAREAVAGRAPDAGAGGPVRLVQQDPARRVERVVAGLGQRVGDPLDPRLVRHRRPWILPRRRALGRILAVIAVHLVQPLRLGVPGLELGVADRPGRGDAVDVLDLAEVLRAQPVQRRAVHLGGAADEIVHLRLERGAVTVVPGIGRDVRPVDEHRPRVPVPQFPGEECAALQQQDPLPGRRERVRQRAAARAGPDHDDVEVLRHDILPVKLQFVPRALTRAQRCSGQLSSPSSGSGPQVRYGADAPREIGRAPRRRCAAGAVAARRPGQCRHRAGTGHPVRRRRAW